MKSYVPVPVSIPIPVPVPVHVPVHVHVHVYVPVCPKRKTLQTGRYLHKKSFCYLYTSFHLKTINGPDRYCVSMKSVPTLFSKLQHKMGH